MASENIIMAMVKAGGNRQVRAYYQGNVAEDARPELHWTPLPSPSLLRHKKAPGYHFQSRYNVGIRPLEVLLTPPSPHLLFDC